jgi:hypothetical protein
MLANKSTTNSKKERKHIQAGGENTCTGIHLSLLL